MDPYVELARLTIAHHVQQGDLPRIIPPEIRNALEGTRVAVFVSIHTRGGDLRGCKGTLEPWQPTALEEVMHNAVSACAHDTRFPPVREEELGDLEIHVDVLSLMEPIRSRSELDVRRYGVLVTTADGRRGVLLPDLESIDTVDQQVAIACRKAGIDPARESYTLARFTTTRHGAG